MMGDWFILIVLVIAAAMSLFFSLRMFHRARLIEDMPTSKVRSCSQGYVELHGTAKWMEGPEIQAPLSGQPCVWYSYTVEKYVANAKNKWRRVDGGVSNELFLLEDDTGACVVDPDGANVTPSSKNVWHANERKGPARHISPIDFLAGSVIQADQLYRYSESRIDVYESLYAIGEFSSMGTDYSQDIKDAAIDRLRELKRDKEKLAEYDINQDGQIDAEEWEQARQDAKQAAIEAQLAKPIEKRLHMLKKPETKKYQPYLLSSKSETHMSRKHRMYSIVLASMFIALSAGVFLKLSSFN